MAKYVLAKGTFVKGWDPSEDQGIDWPAAWGSIKVAFTDTRTKKILARAKRRYFRNMGNEVKAAAVNVSNVEGGVGLGGFCFIAADEFTYFIINKMGFSEGAVKTVRVKPEKGGTDHYFTVIKYDSKDLSIIVDGTWRQFREGDSNISEFCLVGTRSELKKKLKGVNLTIDLDEVYKAGLDVVAEPEDWSCFPDE